MLVTDIQIHHYHYCSKSCRHVADVCMTLKDMVITMQCRLDLPGDEPPRSRAAALVGDAIRQLRRMPEFRAGKNTLTFSDDFCDVDLPQLA